jgi:hypothetical protein
VAPRSVLAQAQLETLVSELAEVRRHQLIVSLKFH